MIPEEIATLLVSGIPIYVATRSAELEPSGARVWAAVVEDDRTHVTLYVHEKAATSVLRDLEACPYLAITFSRPTTHVTCQIKGPFAGARPCRPDERDELDRQTDGFREALASIGIPRAATAHWEPWPCVAVRMRATEFYRQTPGPGAGEPFR